MTLRGSRIHRVRFPHSVLCVDAPSRSVWSEGTDMMLILLIVVLVLVLLGFFSRGAW